ncbi:DUF6199 family natural product biosynthesis protein [Paenibacillus prosopidis]
MSVILIIGGLLMIFKTSVFWKITERWTSKDGTEPSDLYIWNTRFGGIMCTLVGCANLFIYFIL